MGNFSRITFDRSKNYTGVRLQQGVPVVDADWNELNDVVRHELYDGLKVLSPKLSPNYDRYGYALYGPDSFNFSVVEGEKYGTNTAKDFKISHGAGIIEGRPFKICEDIQFSTQPQPWIDESKAEEDGVEPIVPLFIPPSGESYYGVAYLDVWEREVDSSEDSSIMHSGIQNETCVRLKREVAVRVTGEGMNCIVPLPAPGHFFIELFKLKWTGGAHFTQKFIAGIEIDEDLRTFWRQISIPPLFLDVYNSESWKFDVIFGCARSNKDAATCGVIPISLPERSIIKKLYIRGHIKDDTSGEEPKLTITLARYKKYYEIFNELKNLYESFFWQDHKEVILTWTFQPKELNKELNIDNELTTTTVENQENIIVDNNQFYYCLYADAPKDTEACISHLSITYLKENNF